MRSHVSAEHSFRSGWLRVCAAKQGCRSIVTSWQAERVVPITARPAQLHESHISLTQATDRWVLDSAVGDEVDAERDDHDDRGGVHFGSSWESIDS